MAAPTAAIANFRTVMSDSKSTGFFVLSYLNGRDVAVLLGIAPMFDGIRKDKTIYQRLFPIHFPNYQLDSSLPLIEQYQRLAQVQANQTKGISNVQYLTGHTSDITGLRMSANGKIGISGSSDKTLRVWDLATGKCLGTLVGHTHSIVCLDISADGKRAVSSCFNNNICNLWDLENRTVLRLLEGHRNQIRCLQISSDGTRAISGSYDSTLRVWNLETGKCLHTLQGHGSEICCLQMSADGKIAISGSKDCTLKVWDLETGGCLQTLVGHTDRITCLQISVDGIRVVSASSDKTVKLWNLENGRCLGTLTEKEGPVYCLKMSPDRKTIIVVGPRRTIKLWSPETRRRLRVLQGHTSDIQCLQISVDGKRAISGSSDKTFRFWDLETDKCLTTLQAHRTQIRYLHMSSDGRRVISASRDTIKLWDFSVTTEETLLKTAKRFHASYLEGLEFFNRLPKGIQSAIYGKLYLVLGSPENAPRNYGELSFKGKGGFSSTREQRSQAIYEYFAVTFLKRIHGSLEQADSLLTFRSAFKRFNQLPKEMQAVIRSIFVPKLIEYFNQVDSGETLQALLKIFPLLPKSAHNAIYGELYLILGSPRNVPFSFGELAFHERNGFNATNEQRVQAIFNHFSPIFLKIMIGEIQRENSLEVLQTPLGNLQRLSVKMQALIQCVVLPRAQSFEQDNSAKPHQTLVEIFSLLPRSVQNAIYGELYLVLGSPANVSYNYGELAFRGEAGIDVTNQQRAEAIRNYFSRDRLYFENQSSISDFKVGVPIDVVSIS